MREEHLRQRLPEARGRQQRLHHHHLALLRVHQHVPAGPSLITLCISLKLSWVERLPQPIKRIAELVLAEPRGCFLCGTQVHNTPEVEKVQHVDEIVVEFLGRGVVMHSLVCACGCIPEL